MVLKGQFLERPTLIPVDKGLVLEGLWHRGQKRPPALILPPRPEEGSGMDHVVANELAFKLSHQAKHPTLRFNYRSVGGSQGQRGALEDCVKDAESALRVLEENAAVTRTVAVAIGGSARVVLALAELHPGISGIALVSPRDVDADALLRISVPLCVVMGFEENVPNRAALSVAVTDAGGEFHLVEDADQTFRRNLSQVGHVVARWLTVISGEKPAE